MFYLNKIFFKTFFFCLLIKYILTTKTQTIDSQNEIHSLKNVFKMFEKLKNGNFFYFSKQIKPIIEEILLESEIAYKQTPNIFFYKMQGLRENVILELSKLNEEMKENMLENVLENNLENNFKNMLEEKLENKVTIKYLEVVDKIVKEAKIACLVGLEGPSTLFNSLENEFYKNKIEWHQLVFMEYGKEKFLEPIK